MGACFCPCLLLKQPEHAKPMGCPRVALAGRHHPSKRGGDRFVRDERALFLLPCHMHWMIDVGWEWMKQAR